MLIVEVRRIGVSASPGKTWVASIANSGYYVDEDGNAVQTYVEFENQEKANAARDLYLISKGLTAPPLEAKESNPKYACGVKKVPIHCVPTGPLLELGLAMLEGGCKYGTHNYRAVGVRASTYYDAVMARHMPAWWEGEDIDPDSGVHHITKAIACLFVLRDSMLMGNFKDDRPIRYPKGLNIAELNQQAATIIEKYPDIKKPFLATDIKGE